MIYELNLLNDDQIKYILSHYKNEKFVDGKISNPSTKKNNIMLAPSNSLNNYCTQILASNSEIYSVFLIKKISQVYHLQYDIGMEYGYHIDNNPIGGVNAHYSMTCFLSDETEYSGGELVLQIGSKEIEYKLSKGKAVIYPTGIKHKVNKVTSGSRKVFVCWLESSIKNSFIRNHLVDYGKYINELDVDPEILENLEHFRINLMREYGEL